MRTRRNVMIGLGAVAIAGPTAAIAAMENPCLAVQYPPPRTLRCIRHVTNTDEYFYHYSDGMMTGPWVQGKEAPFALVHGPHWGIEF